MGDIYNEIFKNINEVLRVSHDSKLFIQNEQLNETQNQSRQDHSFDLPPMKKQLLQRLVAFNLDQNDQGLHHFMPMSIPKSLKPVLRSPPLCLMHLILP